MNNKKLCILVLSLFFLSFLSGCTKSLQTNQLLFGVKAAQMELWDEAIFRWKKVVASDPNSAAAHNNLAVAYEKKGMLEEARKEYETAMRISPENKHIESNFQKFKQNLEEKEKKEHEKK